MKATKDMVYEFIQQKVYGEERFHAGITTKAIADMLKMQRTNVSAYLNILVKEEKLIKSNTRPVLYNIPTQQHLYSETSCFANLIGHNDSLRNAIQLAKAAVLYPNKCLNILLLTKAGCGKNAFVKSIYDFAKSSKKIKNEAPFIKVNCKDYIKNIDALNKVLFDENDLFEECAFNKSSGGILFIDGFDLLNVNQQNKVFTFLENSTLVGDKKTFKCDNILIILSVDIQNEIQYERKMPVTIKLPSLQERPLQEKFKLISHFFTIEAENANRDIKVTIEVLKALLLMEFTYNIKELEMEIKSACANAFVRIVNEPGKELFVCLHDFKPQVKRELLKTKNRVLKTDEILGNLEFVMYYANNDHALDEDHSEQIYQVIKKQYDELSHHGVEPANIENVINTHIKRLFESYDYNKLDDDTIDLTRLSKIVDSRIINLVDGWLKKCRNELKREFKSNVFYGLCLHINSLLRKDRIESQVENQQINQTIQQYPREYTASVHFSQEIKKEFHIELPIEEIVLLTMFLIDPEENVTNSYPVLLYIMHGSGIASGLKQVTNTLTHCQNAYSYDMELDKDPKLAMQEIKDLILEINQGKGVLVIYDMGSIQTMIDAIVEELNIKIRCLNINITLMGIDIARKCSMEQDIDYIYHMAKKELSSLQYEQFHDNKVIITLCHTGEGGAIQLKNYIDQYSKLNMKIIALSISNKEDLLKEVIELKKVYDIHAFVGTYDPKLLGIPFISISKIFENKKENIDNILMFQPVRSASFDYSDVYKFLKEQFKYASISKIQMVMPELVEEISVVYSLNLDQRLGLFMHLSCLIERLLSGGASQKNKDTDKIINIFEEDYDFIRRKIKRLEKNFKVIIDDNEIVTLIMILKKIKEFSE